MDRKHNRSQPSTHQESRPHNKSGGAHKEQPSQREGHQTEQKKRSGQSR
jgi:hypothetical protein